MLQSRSHRGARAFHDVVDCMWKDLFGKQRDGSDPGVVYAGFRQLKLVRGARSITCFVEFGDVTTAMAVHNSQQVMTAQASPGLALRGLHSTCMQQFVGQKRRHCCR